MSENIRTMHRFPVPATVSSEVKSIGMVILTIEEELQAEERGGGSRQKRALELLKAAIREVNGAKVGLGDASVDAWVQKFSPKLRTLADLAYGKLHLPNDEETDSFLKGMEAVTG